jgi:hypothetical protein
MHRPTWYLPTMSESMVTSALSRSPDPAIRHLAGDTSADVMASPRVRTLLEFPDAHPYKKWWGTHWRLVALADLGATPGAASLRPGVGQELSWLASPRRRFQPVAGLVRRCASQEGNAVYACSKLGFSDDARVRTLVEWLCEWQWPDGGWNCDRTAGGHRSSFHETVTPALGLVAYHQATGDTEALAAARRSAELFLEHRLFRSLRTGDVIHSSWVKLHYPAYWHYDVLQGLRLIDALGLIADPRADDALKIVAASRRPNGFFSGPAWWSAKMPDAVDWGHGTHNDMLNLRADAVLRTRAATEPPS